ncbi:uncharacterized protein LOC107784424 isoform X3 [Nicotiana tabacum]|uniref:Uncharacterized protein LOC107784424 isoform X3 n=1 Tax=Nicotiana tabacum TaxID=4097 RepID=A0A1S3Z9I8_TOBAC|nr:PREDICTED: uncharacterized protein LOC107784424 isoform X2 [Nicotiana tabacum]
MNVLFNACSVAILTRTNSRAVKSSIGAFSALSWKTGVGHNATRKVDSDLLLKRICFRCYSSKKSSGDSSSSEKSDPTPKMKEDRDGFFVVRKGDLVGVYKNLSDCQTQVGSSICDPPVSVYKGYAMPKDTEEYLLSCGLKNALYSIRAADLTEDLFGTLIPCPFQQPSSSKGGMPEHMPKKRSQEVMWSEYSRSCTLEFDGASKGNPGLAGAGAVLRADDGCFICRLREGLGVATNNAAEYRGIILGLKYALSKGFTSIRVQGDAKLVCMQIQGLWKVKNQNISTLYEQAKQLKDRFLSFRIIHVLRESNSDADVQANLGVELAEGQIQEEIEK